MKTFPLLRLASLAVLSASALAHTGGHGNAELEAMIAQWRAAQAPATLPAPASAPAGYGSTMAASFGAFAPRVRHYWDATTFYVEGDNVPDPALMPTLMVGITSWQQQIPLPTSYFASTTNPEKDSGSIGYGKPNVWRLPLVPTPSASPIPISAGNFQRGAIAVGADGIAIFNPRNNTGRVSYEIGELDLYGGHCGLADDYHYHIAPVHLQKVTGVSRPIAWALDGYPIYGYTEPDGTPRLALDAEGGHNHGTWNYHYHAIGSDATGPQNPYLPTAFHGTVVNYGGQVDGQPEVQSMRQNPSGGYEAKAVAGARIIAYKNPVALTTDSAGNLVESTTGTPSADSFLMRVQVGTNTYDECWQINRFTNPKTLKITWRLPTISPTTTTYNSGGNRLTTYGMAAFSLLKVPDTGQTIDATATFGEDSDYTINPPSYTDHGDGTITDRITGLMWQKVDQGESTWENAMSRAAGIATGGYTDWRLPTPTELFSIMNHNNGNPAALNTTYFPSNPAGAAEYWWTSDIYGTDAAKVWCVNAGGGLGPKPKSETVSAGGNFRYHTRYVRGAKPTNGHNYVNNLDGTITDTDTGLMWTQVPASARSWTAALTWAEGLTLAGYSDWRLPNIKELQTITDLTLATATTPSAAVAAVNRVLFPAATTPATAYWSSTALRGGGNNAPTMAWLLELGVATNIPAANGPGRTAQGLVSYEVMTSSYPAFAVRTAARTAAPAITTQPTSFQTAAAGSSVTLRVSAEGEALTYQWRRNGVAVTGATQPMLTFPTVSAAEVGTYTVVITNAAGATTSDNAVVTLGNGRLVNLSVRSRAGTAGDPLIMGFVVGEGAPASLLVRGIGPALSGFGLTGVAADPFLTVGALGGPVLATNDNWDTTANQADLVTAAAANGAFALTPGSKDSALLLSLPAGPYTAQVAGQGSGGIALAEAYWNNSAATTAPFRNVSARAQVGTGADILIAGFAVGGTEPKRVLIRGIGPGLSPFGVTGVLADPQLAIYRLGAATPLDSNNDWSASPLAAGVLSAAAVQVGTFGLAAGSKDAALLLVLEPGVYTAQVSGMNATTGAAMLEIYDVP